MAKLYFGYVGDRKTYDSGIVKYPVTIKLEQLDELKKYVTQAQRINLDFVIKQDGSAFISIFDPNDPDNKKYQKQEQKTVFTQDDVPF